MADHRFDGAASSEPAPFARLHAALAEARQVDDGLADPFRISLVTLVAVGALGSPTDDSRHLPECSLESMAVERVVVQRFDSHHPVVPGGGDHRDLAAELVLLMGLTLGDAFHLGGWRL